MYTSWGPAHEIGHALLSTPAQRALALFGLCSIGECSHHGRCDTIEVAAMLISTRMHARMGRLDLVRAECRNTPDYARLMSADRLRRAKRTLRRFSLTRLPRTVEGLDALLARRLGAGKG